MESPDLVVIIREISSTAWKYTMDEAVKIIHCYESRIRKEERERCAGIVANIIDEKRKLSHKISLGTLDTILRVAILAGSLSTDKAEGQ